MNLKKFFVTSSVTASLLVGGSIVLSPVQAQSAGQPPDAVTEAIDQAKATATALGTLATVALGTALTPFGAMITMRFLNMVLSRV